MTREWPSSKVVSPRAGSENGGESDITCINPLYLIGLYIHFSLFRSPFSIAHTKIKKKKHLEVIDVFKLTLTLWLLLLSHVPLV